MVLSNASNAYTGQTTITAGVLQASDNAGLSANSFLSLNAGILQSNNAASFTRSLGTSGDTFQFTANGGGFSANGGVLTVNIGGSAGTVQWGTTVGSQIVSTLQLGSASANNETLLQNGIDLNGANRTINVTAGTGGDSDVVSGVITNSTGTAGLTKTGNGTLTLTAANNYNGGTIVNGGELLLTGTGAYSGTTSVTSGILQANDGVGLPTGSYLALNGGVLQSNGAASFTRSLGTTGNTFGFTASSGGFSANGGTLTVNIGGSLGTVQWGNSTGGTQMVGTLQLGSGSANSETLFQNPIDLNAATRTISVTAGTGGDSDVISGVISTSTGTAGLTKSGNGTLTLSGANTFNGVITLSTGTLAFTNAGNANTPNSLGESSNAAASVLLSNGTILQYLGPAGALTGSSRSIATGRRMARRSMPRAAGRSTTPIRAASPTERPRKRGP